MTSQKYYCQSLWCRMLGVNKLAVLLAVFAAYPPLIETSNPRYQWEKCIPEINFLSCLDNSADEPKIQYNSLTYELEIEVIRGCASSDLYNYWSLFDKGTYEFNPAEKPLQLHPTHPTLMYSLNFVASGELINPYTDRKNKNTLIIYKSQLELGDYILVAHVRETAVFTGDIWVEKKCYIRIVTACPVPTISGGYYKTVPRGFEVIFSSIRSFTCLMDVTYVWSCSSSEDSENCRNINGKRGKEIKMVADTNVGSTYTVTVTTSVPKVPEKTFTQTIYVTEAAYPVVFITCVKNCLRTGSIYSDPAISLFVKAICYDNCEKIKRYKWTLTALTESTPSVEQIMANGTYYGTDLQDIIFKPNTFSYDAIYDLNMAAFGSDDTELSTARVYINMTSNVGGRTKCSTANNGKSGLLRNYIINCTVPEGPRPVLYKLQQLIVDPLSGERIARTLMYSGTARFQVRLGHSGNTTTQRLAFVAIDDTRIMTNTTFEIEVERPFGDLPCDDLIVSMLHAYHGLERTDSVKFLLLIGKIAEASRLLNVIFGESTKLTTSHHGIARLRIRFQTTVLIDLVSTDRLMLTDMEYLLALLPHLVVAKKKDLHHSKLKSRLCHLIARTFHDFAMKTRYPLTYQAYLELMTIPLHKCANDYFNDDYEKPRKFDIPLPPPLPQHVALVEDYPNYGDEIDDISDEDLMETVSNALKVINEISQVYAHTFVIGEPRIYINYSANTSIDIVHALERNRPPYQSTDLKIVLPDYIGGSPKDTVHIVFSTLPVSAFFWDHLSGKMSNFVVNMKIYDSVAKRITNLQNDAHIYLKATPNQAIPLYNLSMSVPLDSEEWTDDFVEKYMKVFRIGIEARHTVMAVFDDVSPVKLKVLRYESGVAISQFRRPIKADFHYTAEIGKKIYMFNSTDEDTWFYFGFLPDEDEVKQMVGHSGNRSRRHNYDFRFNDDYTISVNRYQPELLEINFSYGFTSVVCKEWWNQMWDRRHCRVGSDSNEKQMHCICSDIATLTVDVKAPTITEQTPLKVKYALTIILNPIILILTIFVFGLYCVCLCFVYTRKKPMYIYFLGDNMEDDLYAYLLVIRTGPYHDCGTTSNIVIQLFGTKSDSRPHVLNYPDPDLHILQNGSTELLVLTTKHHLGDITRIELWYDAIGTRYTWLCECIKIYDLQTRNSWFFSVQKRFTVAEEDMHHYTAVPSSEDGWAPRKHFYDHLRFYTSARHSWVFWKRRDDEVFSFIERTTLLFCEILCSLALSLGLIALPSCRLKDGLGINGFDSFLYVTGYTTLIACVVFAMFAPISILFRHASKKYYHKDPFLEEKAFVSRRVNKCCWIYLLVSMISSIIYLTLFGFWISHISSMMVITITVLSLAANIILLENLKLIVLDFINGRYIERFKRTCTLNFSAIIAEAERQRKFVYRKLGQYGLRPYLTHLYKPMTEERYYEANAEKSVEHRIDAGVSEMGFFYLYTSMLFFLLMIKLDSLTYINSRHIISLAKRGSQGNRPTAEQVRNFEDLYLYLNNTLAQAIHPMSWYGDWNVTAPGLLDDYNTKVLGVVRLRQKRVKHKLCPQPTFSKIVNVTVCHPEFSLRNRDKADRGRGKSMWSFQEVNLANVNYGKIARYGGSGFIINLGRNLNNTYYMINLIKSNDWLNKRTRAVFVEFWTYSINQNVFSAVTLIFERSATQCMLVSDRIVTLKLMHATEAKDILSTIIFVVFCLLILKLSLKFIKKLIKNGLGMLFSWAELWELAIITTNITIVYYHLVRYHRHHKLFRRLCDAKHNEFVPYFALMNSYELLQNVTAILFAFAIARGLSFMKFMKPFRIFEKTFRSGFKSFIAIMLFNFIIQGMFAVSGHLMFGGYSRTFNSLDKALVSLVKAGAALPSDFSAKSIKGYNEGVGHAFYVIYSISVKVLKSLIVCTMLIFYKRSKIYLSAHEYPYSLKKYISERWHYYSEITKRHCGHIRLTGGEDEPEVRLLATPKEAQFRYANAVFIPDARLQYMTLLSRAIVRKLTLKKAGEPLTPVEYELMRRISLSYFTRVQNLGRKWIFFIQRLPRGRRVFVSNNKMLQMEHLLNDMFSKSGALHQTGFHDSVNRLRNIEEILEAVDHLLGNISVVSVKKYRSK